MAIAVLMAVPMLRITVDEKVVFRIVANATVFESFSEQVSMIIYVSTFE